MSKPPVARRQHEHGRGRWWVLRTRRRGAIRGGASRTWPSPLRACLERTADTASSAPSSPSSAPPPPPTHAASASSSSVSVAASTRPSPPTRTGAPGAAAPSASSSASRRSSPQRETKPAPTDSSPPPRTPSTAAAISLAPSPSRAAALVAVARGRRVSGGRAGAADAGTLGRQPKRSQSVSSAAVHRPPLYTAQHPCAHPQVTPTAGAPPARRSTCSAAGPSWPSRTAARTAPPPCSTTRPSACSSSAAAPSAPAARGTRAARRPARPSARPRSAG